MPSPLPATNLGRLTAGVCIVHLLRNSFRYASKKDWAAIARDLKPVYTAAIQVEALDRFAEFAGTWEACYPGDHQAVDQGRGPSSCRSWTTTWRSAECCARRTRSRA